MVKEKKMKRLTHKALPVVFWVSVITAIMSLGNSGIMITAQGADDKELVVMTWGGASYEAQKRAFFDPFTEETGIKVVPVTVSGDMYGRVAAQLKAGKVEWDIVWPDRDVMESAANKGLVEPVDYKIVTDTKGMLPDALNKWGVGFEIVSFVVTYNTKVFPGDNYPKSWNDFYDVKKFPGPRADHNWGTPGWNLISALLADGVSLDNLTPIDYARAFKKLDQIKPSVKVWYTSGDKCVQALMDGEVVMAHTTGARARMAKNNGAPTELVWNQAIYYLNFWSVVKNAPHRDNAMKFLNFVCRPQQQAIFTNYFGSALCNKKSLDYLNPKMLKDLETYPENFQKVVPVLTEKNLKWLVDNYDEMNEKWNEWVSK